MILIILRYKAKAKGSAIPLQAWTGPEGSRRLRLPPFKTSARESGKFVSLTHRSHLLPRKYSWYSFLSVVESTPGPESGRKDYVKEKIPMTPSGIEPATFRLVTQFLNQLHHRVPPILLLRG